MVIRILDVTAGADTQEQGIALYGILADLLKTTDVVSVSFDGVDIATSSFVNAAFVPLLTNMSFSEVKRRIRIVRASRQTIDLIKRRLTREATVAA